MGTATGVGMRPTKKKGPKKKPARIHMGELHHHKHEFFLLPDTSIPLGDRLAYRRWAEEYWWPLCKPNGWWKERGEWMKQLRTTRNPNQVTCLACKKKLGAQK